jgi:hypothetical protein
MTKPESGEKAMKNLSKPQGILATSSSPAAEPGKRGRGRPRTVPAPKPKKPKRKPKSPGPQKAHYINNNVLVDNRIIGVTDMNYSSNSDFQSATKLKDQMTEKELKFIGYYLTGDYTQVNALKSAGYESYNLKYLYRLGRKIVEKYESQADDHRKIARAMGAGEVFVIKGLVDLAKNAKSEAVKLQALVAIAKCLGLQREIVEGAGGITIIFEGGDQPGPAALALPTGEQAQPALPAQPVKVLQITR